MNEAAHGAAFLLGVSFLGRWQWTYARWFSTHKFSTPNDCLKT